MKFVQQFYIYFIFFIIKLINTNLIKNLSNKKINVLHPV